MNKGHVVGRSQSTPTDAAGETISKEYSSNSWLMLISKEEDGGDHIRNDGEEEN